MPRRFPTLRYFQASCITSECSKNPTGDKCCICLEPYDESAHQAVKATSNNECEHVFGRRCLEAWIVSPNPTRNSCPVCRRKWFTRRGVGLSIPGGMNTAVQVQAPSSWSSTSIRDRIQSRTFRRTTSLRNVRDTTDSNVFLQVERLGGVSEELEPFAITDTSPLGQGVRVRLQQAEDRQRMLLQSNRPQPFFRRVVESTQNALVSSSHRSWSNVAVSEFRSST